MFFKWMLSLSLLLALPLLAEETPSMGAPWMEVESQIQELDAKVRSKKTEIESLISQKKLYKKEDPRLKELLKDVQTKHKELQALIRDHEAAVQKMRYRFPERGARQAYKTYQSQSLEQMEEVLTLDSVLSQSLETMRKHFSSASKNQPASGPPPKDQDSIDSALPIIIQK